LVTGDVPDWASIGRALAVSQAGIVFHLAGLTKALRTDDFLRVNAGGVESVAAACADRADQPVLVVVSSLAAAGHEVDTTIADLVADARASTPTMTLLVLGVLMLKRRR
jgi:nucleoside-diphosphate-sugar epimerase